MNIDQSKEEFLIIFNKVLSIYNQAVITFDDGIQWDVKRVDDGFRFGVNNKQDFAFREKLHKRIVSNSFAFIISVLTTEIYKDKNFIEKYGFIYEGQYKNSSAQDLMDKYKKHTGLDDYSVFCDLSGEKILC